MKLSFFQSNKDNWGDQQAKVSELLCEYLKSGKDFFVQFGADKTPKQQRGYWRLCDLLVPSVRRDHGEVCDKDFVSDLAKLAVGFSYRAGKQQIPKSLKLANRDDMNLLIEKLYQICAFYKLENYELTSAERQALVDYYQQQ